MTAKVFVTLKKGVLDPQGKAVEQSLRGLVSRRRARCAWGALGC
jgi:phosphoribosylformylglycinamidine (FGAM) synthase PurS component